MRLCFSTIACPDWSFDDMLSACADIGYDGVEIYGAFDEIGLSNTNGVSVDKVEIAKSKLVSYGVKIPILTTGEYLALNLDAESAELKVKEHIMLAGALGVKYVGVRGERSDDPRDEVDYKELLERYIALCGFAAEHDVHLLIETSGFLADSSVMKRFMEDAKCPNSGVIWDMHHTIRFFKEDMMDTMGRLHSRIRHVHVKDSIVGRNGKLTYMLNGYGSIPIDEAYRAVSGTGYDGFYSYEWGKNWVRQNAEPKAAFGQYLEYMKDILR